MKDRLRHVLVMLFVIIPFGTGFASNNNVTFQSVDIQHAILTLVEDGTSVILRFSIRNETSDTITLLGVRSPLFEQSNILVKLSESKTQRLSSLSIPSEEILDLTTNHIFIKLTGKKPHYNLPDDIEMRLLFANGELPFVAHARLQHPSNVQRKIK